MSLSAPLPSSPADPILLELVDPDGRTIGTEEKLAAHQMPGKLHRAFSVFLFDAGGRMLLQQRALSKYHSPGVWSNTCCGHPYPGEAPEEAAARRTREELGIENFKLVPVGTVTYYHPDELSGLVEHEYNHLFAGIVDDTMNLDPEEVHDTRFVTAEELARLRDEVPFSAWFPSVFEAALPGIRGVVPPQTW
ncbi:isopentenyl-diphosphate Delta-isomerase [Streptomyces violascens]|uniref:isopentenyl-diphosphate Delta-isomerase n=1 Tax=Streptomyces violascens TaxID=67381 RepID=UPI003661EFF4